MLDPLHILNRLCGRHPGVVADDDMRQSPGPVEAAPVLDTSSLPSRYQAYGVLYNAGIPLCIWSEDALEHFGVPTQTFCLFLVVPGVQLAQAAHHLERAGYKKMRPLFALSDIPQFDNVYGPEPPRQVASLVTEPESQGGDVPPIDPDEGIDSSHPPVILLSADEWFYELPPTVAGMHDCFPSLPHFLTSSVSKWLALAEDDDFLRLRLAVQIQYIYKYLDEAKQPGFEENLPPHLRSFHLDRVNATKPRRLDCFATQKTYLEQIRNMGSAEGEGEQGKAART